MVNDILSGKRYSLKFLIINSPYRNIETFNIKLEKVSDIKKMINVYLNEGDLIFIHKDSFDAKDYKKRIFDDAIERG